MNPMIEVSALTKAFGDVIAVKDVTFAVRPGEFLTLLGPSGCGKTTLLRMLSGFEQPTQGTIRINGADVTALPPQRRDVNQVFQSYALFPHLTVRENVSFGLQMQRRSREEINQRVREGLAMVALQEMAHRFPHELSGGQRQRVALARAIVPGPRILLLDEPLSALDAKLRRSMQIEIKRLQRQLGLTTILVTHDQDEALALSDRIAVMNAGCIEQLDTPERIYQVPRNAFVAEFMGESNVFAATVEDSADNPSAANASPVETISLRLSNGLSLRARKNANPPAVGTACHVSIRPENLQAGSFEATLQNRFEGELVEKVFLGSTVRATVRLHPPAREAPAATVSLIQPATSFLGVVAIGATIACCCAPESVVVLPA